MTRGKHKIDKQEIAWWTYLAIMVGQCGGRTPAQGYQGRIHSFNGIIIWNNSRNL